MKKLLVIISAVISVLIFTSATFAVVDHSIYTNKKFNQISITKIEDRMTGEIRYTLILQEETNKECIIMINNCITIFYRKININKNIDNNIRFRFDKSFVFSCHPATGSIDSGCGPNSLGVVKLSHIDSHNIIQRMKKHNFLFIQAYSGNIMVFNLKGFAAAWEEFQKQLTLEGE